MPKYKESKIVGDTWTRAFQIIGHNMYGSSPKIRYDEEEVFLLSDNKFANISKGSYIEEELTENNSTELFQLRDPITEEFIDGKYATYQELFLMIYSFYFHLAKKRDENSKPDGDYWIWDQEFHQWVDIRPPMPIDGKEYVWQNNSWIETNNGS